MLCSKGNQPPAHFRHSELEVVDQELRATPAMQVDIGVGAVVVEPELMPGNTGVDFLF